MKNLIRLVALFCIVFVYKPLNSQNLALQKSTIQSSIYGNLSSGLATDGDTNGDSHTHTKKDVNPYWRVDLSSSYNIGTIKVFNRNSTSQWVLDRLIGFKVYIGNTDSTNPNDYIEIATLDSSSEQLFENINLSGRYIMVYGANKNEFLSLAELEVYESTSATDNQQPTPPTISSSEKTSTSIQLSWSGATDNVGVTGYKIFVNGNNLANTLGNLNNYTIVELTANTTYTITMTSLDANGNESPMSNSIEVTTEDNNNPTGGDSLWTQNGTNINYIEGNVGIGTATPTTKLAVNGNIRAKEIKVESDHWPDYVFKKNYNLPSLEEVEKHIKEKGHLPKIPSAKEVKINGIKLGEMNKALLEKIEELTLYTLEQQQLLNKQQIQIESLQKQVNTLLKMK